MNKKIVFIVGSLRKGSFNRQVAAFAKELIGARAEVEFLEYADIPYMNQDIEFPAPREIAKVRSTVQSADGIWIFTAEYNHQIPGVLKNLLDWLSRPLDPMDAERVTAVSGKAVTLSGAGGRLATAGCRENLRALLEFMRMRVMTDCETGIALPAEAFKTGQYEIDEETRRKLMAQADAFIDFI